MSQTCKPKSDAAGHRDSSELTYTGPMVIQIRKGARPHVYLREWRKHLDLKATAMADRLEIERESYYRLERDPDKLNVAELREIAEAMGIEPTRLWEPPPPPGLAPRVSLDAIVRDATDSQVEALATLLKQAVGKTGTR